MSKPNDTFSGRCILPVNNIYDRVICGSALYHRLFNHLFWAEPDSLWCGDASLRHLPLNFRGRLLDVPCGTGLFTADTWRALDRAEIECLDYSEEMMAAFKARLAGYSADHIHFRQGDVGELPYPDAHFDVVLCMNGLHCFPDKDAAYREIHRVLRPGGVFIGCLYVKGALRRTDFFVRTFYECKGFFRPPYDTLESLRTRLAQSYYIDSLEPHKALAAFCVTKK